MNAESPAVIPAISSLAVAIPGSPLTTNLDETAALFSLRRFAEADDVLRELQTGRVFLPAWIARAEIEITWKSFQLSPNLKTETNKSILSRLARLLRPDGYLLLGGAETTYLLDDSYRRAEGLKAAVYHLVG